MKLASMQAQVVVVGAGPCGVTIANYLGMFGIRTVLFDRSPDIIDHPRAVGADDETLRSWQAVGLADEVLADMIQNVPARYHNSKGRCIAQVRPQAQPFGWPRRNIFLQPLTEASLRGGLRRFPAVELRLGWEVERVEQDADGVSVQARSASGESLDVRCDYLVGADGGRSTVRRQLGIELTGKTDSSKWLVVDVENDALYSPFTDIYYHPVRPHICINLPYGYRRFEFMLLPDDSEELVQRPEHLARLIQPHYPPGMPLPSVKRSRVYLHHSRIAERFQVGRAFLAGDAAHLQPPFFGQGMNSGIRDATNLAWKLCAVLSGRAAPAILESYDAERRDHALAMVNIATWMGSFYRPWNRFTEAIRDAFFDAVQGLPSVRDYILQLRFKPMPRYREGIVDHAGGITKASPVGRMFMQPRVETADRRQLRLDDAIGPWFALIGVNVDPLAQLSAEDRAFWRGLGARAWRIDKSRSRPGARAAAVTPDTQVLEDVEGRFRDWLTANPALEVIVLRPDRYVAAACRHDEVAAMTGRFRRLLGVPERAASGEHAAPDERKAA